MPIATLVILVLIGVVALWLAAVVAGAIFAVIPAILVGLLAGWVAGQLLGSRFGLVGTALIGIVGSFIGTALFSLLRINAHGVLNPMHIVSSIVGATILLAGIHVVDRRQLPYNGPRGLRG